MCGALIKTQDTDLCLNIWSSVWVHVGCVCVSEHTSIKSFTPLLGADEVSEDVVIAGHNGVYGDDCCEVIHCTFFM